VLIANRERIGQRSSTTGCVTVCSSPFVRGMSAYRPSPERSRTSQRLYCPLLRASVCQSNCEAANPQRASVSVIIQGGTAVSFRQAELVCTHTGLPLASMIAQGIAKSAPSRATFQNAWSNERFS